VIRVTRMLAHVCLGLALVTAARCGRQAGPPADGRIAVWLDVSPSFDGPPRDPGDAFAIVQAFGSARLRVRGVSTTFGNVPLVRGFPAAQALLEQLDGGTLRPWRGASSPDEREAPTEATELLAEALDEARLTLVAAGPATTVASVLQRRPDLAARIERLVLVAGLPDEATDAAVDPHVAADPQSVRLLLESDVAITVVPADAAGFTLAEPDLVRLDAADALVRRIVGGARAWLAHSKAAQVAMPAMLAVDVVAHPGEVRCEAAVARLETPPGGPATLRVSGMPGAPGRRVSWCHTADPGARERILKDLLAVRSTR
jgi:pyrimidine-specific ribonucleoside hydrolase